MRKLPLLLALAALTACDRSTPTEPVTSEAALDQVAFDDDSDGGARGAVYTINNDASGNAVLRFARAANGSLTPAGVFPTDGLGSSSGLGNQGAVILTRNGRLLVVVNAGSNEITSFRLRRGDLARVSTVPSGGVLPVSVTTHGRLLYALNAGGTGNIAGFRIGEDGGLTPIAGSARPLSSPAAGAAQVEFSPNGKILVVTEKATNKLSTYVVGPGGLTSGPLVMQSAGATPFGFTFDRQRGVVIVSEAFGGAPDASAASSYTFNANGALSVVSASVPTTETAACWFVVTRNGRYAYTTNTGSGTVSGYFVDGDGGLHLLNPDGLTAVIGAGSSPTDEALSRNSRYLFTLNVGNGTITGFTVGSDGSLTPAGSISGVPATASGLAAS